MTEYFHNVYCIIFINFLNKKSSSFHPSSRGLHQKMLANLSRTALRRSFASASSSSSSALPRFVAATAIAGATVAFSYTTFFPTECDTTIDIATDGSVKIVVGGAATDEVKAAKRYPVTVDNFPVWTPGRGSTSSKVLTKEEYVKYMNVSGELARLAAWQYSP